MSDYSQFKFFSPLDSAGDNHSVGDNRILPLDGHSLSSSPDSTTTQEYSASSLYATKEECCRFAEYEAGMLDLAFFKPIVPEEERRLYTEEEDALHDVDVNASGAQLAGPIEFTSPNKFGIENMPPMCRTVSGYLGIALPADCLLFEHIVLETPPLLPVKRRLSESEGDENESPEQEEEVGESDEQAGPVQVVRASRMPSARAPKTSQDGTYWTTLKPRPRPSYQEDKDDDNLQAGPSSRTERAEKRSRLNEAGASVARLAVTVAKPAEAKSNAVRQEQPAPDGKPEGARNAATEYRILEKAGLFIYPQGDPVGITLTCLDEDCAGLHVVSVADMASAIIAFCNHCRSKRNDGKQVCPVEGCTEKQTYTGLKRHFFKDHLGLRIRCSVAGCPKSRATTNDPFVKLDGYKKHMKDVHKCTTLLPPVAPG